MMLMNKRILVSTAIIAASLYTIEVAQAQDDFAFTTDQYQKALWMTTRFYGAQRSGYGPNWLTATHEPTNVPAEWLDYAANAVKGVSYIKDADPQDGYDLTGGWFDCADYVKFGQTEFYSAYVLLLGYSEFPKGYGDYYSADYNGYIGSNDYSWEGKAGVPNGIPDILDEVKYATDYFMKCMRAVDTFYYQVGEGGIDHKVWCTSVFKSALPKALGGEAEGSRTVYRISARGTSMVALCGASLAAMSRLYRPYDAAYADLCLKKAKVAYDYIMENLEGNIGAPGGFYGAKGRYEPDCTILLMELFRATGDSSYVELALDPDEGFASFMYGDKTWNHGFSLCYGNTEDLAYYLMGNYAGVTLAQERLKSYVFDLYRPASGYILNKKYDKWGMLRYPANQAFVYGLYNKMVGNLEKVDPYSLASVEYIMGNNSANFSFITGFGDKYARYPHYRNVYLDDSNNMSECEIDDNHRQLGYLVGGSFNPDEYPDNINNYQTGEGGIDYNAGLVGALGYINSIVCPVELADTSSAVSKVDGVQTYLYPNPTTDYIFLSSAENGSVRVTVSNAEGQLVKQADATWQSLKDNGINVSDLVRGTYVLNVASAAGSTTKLFVKR